MRLWPPDEGVMTVKCEIVAAGEVIRVAKCEIVACQVGNYTVDRNRWNRPEDIRDKRPVYFVTTKNGANQQNWHLTNLCCASIHLAGKAVSRELQAVLRRVLLGKLLMIQQ
jgi:hypothetical protein